MEPCIRDTALQYFLAEAKKTDGNDYPSASLYQLFVAIQGQIRLSDPAVNLLTQPTYVKCRKVLDSMMKKRSAEGLGVASRRRAEPISSLEENILWERAVIGSDNPPKLLDTMVYLIGIHFALRGGKEHRNLRLNKNPQITGPFIDSELHKRYILYKEDISKTNSGGMKDKKYTPKTVKAYENIEYPDRCIVTLFEKYKHLCPKDEVDAFYFKPLVNFTTDQWFCKVPVGHNTLQKTVKRLCTAVGLEGKRTNHSLRASTATRLYQAGVEEQLICETTGHRSNAVRSYKRTANFQQNESSEILYGKKQKTTTCTETKVQSQEEKTSRDTSHQIVNIEAAPKRIRR
ncbi:zinc finger MYM-type protein 2-like [Mytilus galloprovincialis]|uniref:zinc finger MYM-type protein 2-like n=1 Tax=Mytilus galloprovincialis TaxID=29158 RepID=UPI003F7C92A9